MRLVSALRRLGPLPRTRRRQPRWSSSASSTGWARRRPTLCSGCSIPPLLRERLEPLPLAGYDDEEKHRIATRPPDPATARAAPAAPDPRLRARPGVCLLDDRIDTLCRRTAPLRAEGSPPPGEMTLETVARWLGVPRFRDAELASRTPRPGVALGLGLTRTDGDVLVVGATRLPGGGALRFTGTVGPKMPESANVALTWVRTNAGRFAGVDASFDDATYLHVHLPDAGRSKDGPSAGVTLAVAIVSALTGRPVRRDMAMTGELTLSGQVEPVAGTREKVQAAGRAGMATVVLPAAEADVSESFLGGLPSGISVALRQHHGRGAHGRVARRGVARDGLPAAVPVLQPPDQVVPTATRPSCSTACSTHEGDLRRRGRAAGSGPGEGLRLDDSRPGAAAASSTATPAAARPGCPWVAASSSTSAGRPPHPPGAAIAEAGVSPDPSARERGRRGRTSPSRTATCHQPRRRRRRAW